MLGQIDDEGRRIVHIRKNTNGDTIERAQRT